MGCVGVFVVFGSAAQSPVIEGRSEPSDSTHSVTLPTKNTCLPASLMRRLSLLSLLLACIIVITAAANPVLVQGGDTCRVFEDELGGPPEVLLNDLRYMCDCV